MGFGTFFASRDSHVTCTNDLDSAFKGIKVESMNMRNSRTPISVPIPNREWKRDVVISWPSCLQTLQLMKVGIRPAFSTANWRPIFRGDLFSLLLTR